MKNVQENPVLRIGETIDGIDHPDPRMRPARLSLRIPALFWERVRRHIERCQSSPAERTLWEQWLSPQAVAALLSDSAMQFRSGAPIVPETALRQLRETIRQSLQHPLALRLASEPAGRPGSPAADPTYLLVLTNGASLVLRVTDTNKPTVDEMIPARLDDCFFTRAAADFARPAGDFALAASPGSHHSEIGSQGRMRDAVVREWVGRFALASGTENNKGLVPPDRPCDVNGPALSASNGPALSASNGQGEGNPGRYGPAWIGSDTSARTGSGTIAEPRVQFLMPTAWGFSGGANGCVWAGHESPSDSEESTDTDALRRLFGEGGKDRVLQADRSNRNTSPDRMPRRRSRYSVAVAGAQANGSRRPAANDAMACLPELTRAMDEYPWAWVRSGESLGERPAADSSAHGAEYRSAVAMGRCRLLGPARADLVELALAPAVGVSAARELAGRLKHWAKRAKSLPADMRGAGAARASDLCMGLLEARLEAWAAYLAIDESYSAALDAADASADTFSQAINAALDGLAAFDDAIQFAEPLLAAAAPASRLLDNWKTLLAAPYRQSPPWWLDCVPAHATLEAEELS